MLTLPQRDIIIWLSADSALNCGLLQCQVLNLALCFHFHEHFNPVWPFSLPQELWSCNPGCNQHRVQVAPGGTWPGTLAAMP